MTIHYLIIGNGRLARHLQFYFESLSLSYFIWHHATHFPEELIELATKSVRILLAIPDRALAPFILAYPSVPKEKWLHLSGALSLPGIYSAHPLGSFGEKLNPVSWYSKIYFIIEQQLADKEMSLSELLPGVPNLSAKISSQDKAYYHSLCVLSNNFTTILFQKLFSGLEQDLHIPKVAAYNYLRQTVYNLEKTNNPLTGPLARNDKDTIEKNIKSLKDRQDSFAEIYEAFVHLTNVNNIR